LGTQTYLVHLQRPHNKHDIIEQSSYENVHVTWILKTKVTTTNLMPRKEPEYRSTGEADQMVTRNISIVPLVHVNNLAAINAQNSLRVGERTIETSKKSKKRIAFNDRFNALHFKPNTMN
jgi:hypothetical protein